ncbi:hypothetical protein LIER_09701 [Lithospermum erythrorhizon]|uniref:Uncharacterized protein n=1 Tax=Lithospermum erythrorhizon TaxID=34254 RepID=A0AAV3PLH6_LITER
MSFDNEEYSDNDDAFEEDMEALRRACLLTGTNQSGDATCTLSDVEESDDDGEDSADDDIELVRNLQKRFCDYAELTDKLSLTPLWSVPPVDDDNDVEDDFEALRAIRRRFAAYNDGGVKENTEDSIKRIEQVGVTNELALEKEASNNLFIKKNNNAEEGFPDCVDTNNIATDNVGAFGDPVASDLVGACSDRVTSELVEWQDNGARNVMSEGH